MDPPTAFSNANAASYNLAEIWQFPMSGAGVGGGVVESSGGLGVRRMDFGRNLGPFVDTVSVNHHHHHHEVSCDEAMNVNTTRNNSHVGSSGSRKRLDLEEDSAKGLSTSSGNGNGMTDCDGKRLKRPGYRDEKRDAKAEIEHNSTKPADETAQIHQPSKQDYIHVRARRGQATDSHSLAERARREKISERMKILQDLVPGCNKVIGKALVLDEIINYIQSLQRQVEFLSMKLETVNSRLQSGIDVFQPKDFSQQTFDTTGMAYGSQANREYGRGSSPEWLHMQVGGGFERTP